MFNLLASRGLFAALIVIVVIVVLLCIGLAAMLFFKPFKTKDSVEADAVKRELYRRETELVIKLVKDNATGKEREDYLAELRRIRSAEILVDDVIRTEKAERGIVDKPTKGAKPPVRRPAPAKPAPAANASEAPEATAAKSEAAQTSERPAKEKPVVKKKKDSLEFKPFED